MTGVTTSTPLNANVPTTPGQQLDDSIVNREYGSMLQNLQLVDDPVQFERFRFINTSIAGMQEFEECTDSPVNRLCCNFQVQVVPRGLPGNLVDFWGFFFEFLVSNKSFPFCRTNYPTLLLLSTVTGRSVMLTKFSSEYALWWHAPQITLPLAAGRK